MENKKPNNQEHGGDISREDLLEIFNIHYNDLFSKLLKKTQEEFISLLKRQIILHLRITDKQCHSTLLSNLYEKYQDTKNYYLITEYCEGGSLFDLITKNKGPFTEIQTSYIMHQIFSVVNYCHKMKIIHRDLKPENILVQKNDNGFVKIKICYFGTWLTFNRGEIQDKIVGSIYYIAPEVLQKKYNSKCGLWSCGK
jgi:calcium-dependent protein kinase